MLYNSLKVLHILSASLLITSIAYSAYLWYKMQKMNNTNASERIQTQTWSVIIPFAVFQLATGFTMLSLKQEDFNQLWISGSVLGFIGMIVSWFAFIYFLLSCERKMLQSSMLFICTMSLLSMIFFMANKIC